MKLIALLTGLLVIGGCTRAGDFGHMAEVALFIEMEGGGSCSATAVGQYTLLTAAHCLEDGALAKVNGVAAKALHVEQDGNDHALVKVDLTFKAWARLGPRPLRGDRVAMLGNPTIFRGVYREGIFSGANLTYCPEMKTMTPRQRCESWLFQMPVGSGDSGAGYFDAFGRLIAVHSASVPIGTVGSDWYQALPAAFPLAFKPEQWKAAGV